MGIRRRLLLVLVEHLDTNLKGVDQSGFVNGDPKACIVSIG